MFWLFRELHAFDLKLGVNFRIMKYGRFNNSQYMRYLLVYTSVCNEMNRMTHDYRLSGIRKVDYEMNTTRVDFRRDFEKSAFLASEANKFDFVFSVNIDSRLMPECNKISLKLVKNEKTCSPTSRMLKTIP